MNCPRCGVRMRQSNVKTVTIERCPQCRGTWYEADQLRLLKDREHKGDYRWIDIDLWRDLDKFAAGEEQRQLLCPKDGGELTTVHYGEFPIHIDCCRACRGIWLDSGEYQRLLEYLDEKVDSESVGDYLDDLKEEFVDIFTGPEGPASEAADFLKVLHLLELRFVVEHSNIAETLFRAARGFPGAT